MLRNLALLIVLVLAGLALAYFYDRTPDATPIPVAVDDTVYPAAPDFAFTTLDGQSHSLSEYRGKIVLLNFWASWCVPCVAEFPQFIKLANAFPEDVVVLALSVDTDRAAMERFLASLPALKTTPNMLVAVDEGKQISQDLFQTFRYPETVLIGPDQTMRRKYLGIELDWSGPEFAATIRSLLAASRRQR